MAARWTLQDELDWYTEQAADHRKPPDEQRLWQQLADELSARLGINPSVSNDDTTLF
jgi:hypothetical protein